MKSAFDQMLEIGIDGGGSKETSEIKPALGHLMNELLQLLHLMSEDMKLKRGGENQKLKNLILEWAQQLKISSLVQYYSGQGIPTDIFILQEFLKQTNQSCPLILFDTTRKIIKLYEAMLDQNWDLLNARQVNYKKIKDLHIRTIQKQKLQQPQSMQERVLFMLDEEKFTDFEKLEYQVQLPLQEIIRFVRLNLSEVQTVHWPKSIYKLIQREDIVSNLPQTGQLNRQLSIQEAAEVNLQDIIVDLPSVQESQAPVTLIRKDTRFQEVEFLLRSDLDMKINLQHCELADNGEEEQQKVFKQLLQKKFKRQLSKCVGRGAFELGTIQTLPTEKLDVPKISEQGFSTQKTNFEKSVDEEKENLQSANFHNGVAVALKICQNSFHRSSYSSVNDTRNWIMYHRPQNPRNDHGGFLLGLGLLGQLDTLQMTDVYQHLKTAHDATTIGMLLGRAASKLGQQDEQDSRMMSIHIPALLPQNLTVEYSLPVQSAAIVGSGMLYMGTGNKQTTKMLLTQIDRKPQNDKLTEREGYALAAGIALGLVNLNNPKIDSELELEHRLIKFVEGGKQLDTPKSVLQNIQNHHKSSAVKETDQINTYITASGALIALTMIYLQSNDAKVSNRIVIPESFEQMDLVRQQLLVQKIVCKNLIMWDTVACTQDWIDNQIPQIVRFVFNAQSQEELDQRLQKRINQNDVDLAAFSLSYVNIKSGCLLSLGFKYAGTGNFEAKQLILNHIHWLRTKLRCVPCTQACGGPVQTNTSFLTKNQVDRTTVDSSLCTCAFALSMVMAGSCDLDCFRVLRVLRKRFEPEMHFGYNQAIHMAIGFLFIGNGVYTFSRSSKAIAGLLCAVYPVYPATAADNRYHLQALRHFYVLALESRFLQATEIDSGKPVHVQTQVQVLTDQGLEIQTINTPEIVKGQIKRISVKNNQDYLDVDLDIRQQSNFHQILFVKRKNIKTKPEPSIALTVALNHDDQIIDQINQDHEPAVKQFIDMFCTTFDAKPSLIQSLLMTNDVYTAISQAEQVKVDDTRTRLNQATLADCQNEDNMQILGLMLSNNTVRRLEPSKISCQNPLIPYQPQQNSNPNLPLVIAIFEELRRMKEGNIVAEYLNQLAQGQQMQGVYLELHNAVMLCGFGENEIKQALIQV